MTADATLDVVGIGNALVDVLSHETDEFIAAHGLVKSAMTLIETARAEELYSAMGPGIEMSGGSAANTIAGVASFGGNAAYMAASSMISSAPSSPTTCARRASPSTTSRRPRAPPPGAA